MQILRLSSVGSKFAKFFMSFFKAPVSSLSKFASFFSDMVHDFSVIFQLKHNILLTKVAHQSGHFQTLKFAKFVVSFLEPSASFLSNFASLFSFMRHSSSYFFIQNFICFEQMEPIKVKVFILSTAPMKTNQILYVIFQATSQFSLNFESPFSAMTHNPSEMFLLKHYMLWTKKANQSTIFQTFECSNEISSYFSYHF